MSFSFPLRNFFINLGEPDVPSLSAHQLEDNFVQIYSHSALFLFSICSHSLVCSRSTSQKQETSFPDCSSQLEGNRLFSFCSAALLCLFLILFSFGSSFAFIRLSFCSDEPGDFFFVNRFSPLFLSVSFGQFSLCSGCALSYLNASNSISLSSNLSFSSVR